MDPQIPTPCSSSSNQSVVGFEEQVFGRHRKRYHKHPMFAKNFIPNSALCNRSKTKWATSETSIWDSAKLVSRESSKCWVLRISTASRTSLLMRDVKGEGENVVVWGCDDGRFGIFKCYSYIWGQGVGIWGSMAGGSEGRRKTMWWLKKKEKSLLGSFFSFWSKIVSKPNSFIFSYILVLL